MAVTLYWHMGGRISRLRRVRPDTVTGSKRRLMSGTTTGWSGSIPRLTPCRPSAPDSRSVTCCPAMPPKR
ncbi:hypothetical protein ACFFX0_22300 [Citricoccus parietis]|uniref:Uncharacterized protein n=1 Tax=Citricoccus parietis TaxID=592307 RepID=A0ABV5G4C4_9MICC